MIFDKFGTELHVGDMVCFVGNPDAGWRQNKDLVRVRIKGFTNNKNNDFIIYDDDKPRVATSRVVKCY